MGHKLRSILVAAVVVGPLVCQPGNEAAFVGAAAREDIPDDWLGLEGGQWTGRQNDVYSLLLISTGGGEVSSSLLLHWFCARREMP